jgi:hypothetical protein
LGTRFLLAKKQIANCLNFERNVESLEQGINCEMLNSHQSDFIPLPYEDTPQSSDPSSETL